MGVADDTTQFIEEFQQYLHKEMPPVVWKALQEELEKSFDKPLARGKDGEDLNSIVNVLRDTQLKLLKSWTPSAM